MDSRGKVVFWGAGKIGKRMLLLWRHYKITPSFFCDTDIEKQGTYIDGIPIVGPSTLADYDDITIIVTIYCVEEVKKYINNQNISAKRIIDGSSTSSFEMMDFIFRYSCSQDEIMYLNKGNANRCVMDFSYGTELGGVQTWCYYMKNVLDEIGVATRFLLPNNRQNDYSGEIFVDESVSTFSSEEDIYIDSYIEYFKNNDIKYVVINFPREIMCAAFVVKKYYKPDMVVVAVIHSDDEIYYENYFKSRELVDVWCAVSDKIEQRIIHNGIDPNRVIRIHWKSETRYIERNNKKIKIGYAGRIVIPGKRIDNVLRVAEIIKNSGMDFELEIAGTGESESYLKEEIIKKNLDLNVKYLGLVNHDEIYDFWDRQDIYLSCSDYEGHSISQYEGMSRGAVPVVTDTSGARDDIEDGVNGYILPLDDMEGIANKILYLKEKPELLRHMACKCVETINERNHSTINDVELWEGILKA